MVACTLGGCVSDYTVVQAYESDQSGRHEAASLHCRMLQQVSVCLKQSSWNV